MPSQNVKSGAEYWKRGSLAETTQSSKSPPKPKSVDVERDLIGVGAGPANLSLASLLTTASERGLTSVTATFFEREATVYWHSLQMFPGSLMQTEFYRDPRHSYRSYEQIFLSELS